MISTHSFTASCVEIINELGIDEVSVSAVCTKAGVTRPTFYSKLGNVEGLLAETWLEYAEEFYSVMEADAFEPTANFLALSKILAVSHRVPDVSAVTDLSLLGWWAKLEQSEKDRVKAWQKANRLGWAVSTPAVQFPDSYSTIDQALSKVISHSGPDIVASPATELELLSPLPLNEIHEATVRAIGQWGYKHASMARIARTLRVTSGAIYPSHSSISKLREDAYAGYQAQISSLNLQTWKKYPLTPANYGSFIRGGLTPARKAWRQLRLETLLAAHSRKDLDASLQAAIDEMSGAMKPTVMAYGASESTALMISYLLHTLGVGFGLLHDLGLPIVDVNHEKAAVEIAAELIEAETAQVPPGQ